MTYRRAGLLASFVLAVAAAGVACTALLGVTDVPTPSDAATGGDGGPDGSSGSGSGSGASSGSSASSGGGSGASSGSASGSSSGSGASSGSNSGSGATSGSGSGTGSGSGSGSGSGASGSGSGSSGGGSADGGRCSAASSTCACDLADPNSCGGGGIGCLENYVGGFTYCASTAGGQQGAACAGPSHCAPGFACPQVECGGASNGICLEWCHLPGGACPPGTTCRTGTACCGGACTFNGQAYGLCQAGADAGTDAGCTLVTHSNGLAGTWQDCTPLGTYNATEAMAACNSTGGGACHLCTESCLQISCVQGGNGYWFYTGYPGTVATSLDSSLSQCGPQQPFAGNWQ